MPKQARNTKRGSRVAHAAQHTQQLVQAAIAHAVAHPAVPLTQIAADTGVPYFVLWRRMKRYRAAARAGDAAGMEDAARSHRGGHNRTFTPAQESLLRDTVLAAAPAMAHQQIRTAALQLAADVGVARGLRDLRHRGAFTASDGFVSAFKQRNRLSSHRCALLHVSARELAARDIDTECFHYCLEVRRAIDECGAGRVLNMDETPTQVVDMPLDVGVNGPMLKARQRIWLQERIRRPGVGDTYQAAVERTQQAYDAMSKALVRGAFRKAQLID